MAASRRYALHKELRRRITQHGIPPSARRIGGWKIQRRDTITMFALHPQQFATCGQQMDLLGPLKELLGDRGDCFDHVLAAIEDDKQLSANG